jgi:hypothetical protein
MTSGGEMYALDFTVGQSLFYFQFAAVGIGIAFALFSFDNFHADF